MRKRKKPHSLFDVKQAYRILRKVFRKSRLARGFSMEGVMKMTTYSSLWLRRVCTTTQSPDSRKRFGLAALAVVGLSAVLLTACGGGGGGDTTTPITPTPPPVAKKQGVLNVSACAVEAGNTSCPLSATATQLQNVTVTSFQVPGSVPAVPGPGPSAVMASLGTVTVVLTGDGEKLDEKSLTVGCATGLVVQGTTCILPKANGTLSVPQSTVADDGNTASVVVSFTSSNTTALSVTLGSGADSETKNVPAGSGQVTFTRTGVADLPVSLKDNGVEIASGVSKATCSNSAAWDTPWTKCRVILPSYSDYVVGIWGIDGVPYIVNKAGATLAINKTPWQLPTAGLFFCGLRKVNNPDLWGYINGSCQDSLTLKERPFMINPQTKELTLSSPIDPYSPAYVVGNPVDYRYADAGDPSYTLGSTQARIIDGTLYTPGNGDGMGSIRFRADSGADLLVSPGTIADNGNVKLLQTFRHTKP